MYYQQHSCFDFSVPVVSLILKDIPASFLEKRTLHKLRGPFFTFPMLPAFFPVSSFQSGSFPQSLNPRDEVLETSTAYSLFFRLSVQNCTLCDIYFLGQNGSRRRNSMWAGRRQARWRAGWYSTSGSPAS